MPGRRDVPKQQRYFSLIVSILIILNSLFIGISVNVPNTSAIPSHTISNVELIQLTEWGRILKYISWMGTRQTVNDGSKGGMGYIGLVIDHDGYDHSPGAENITDSYKSWWYTSQDDLKHIVPQSMIIDNTTTQKSFGSSQNKGVLTGDPDDILINQTAWTFANKDWAIIQWSLYNLKGVDITNLRIGLEMPLSYSGKYGIGGDGGDDIDGFDGVNDIYWAQDDGGTTMGLSSAITSEPITHYYCEDGSAFASFDDYKVAYEDETWLYNRITAPNQVVGTSPGNRISTVGWDGITLGSSSVKTFTLVIAFGDSSSYMNTAVQEAQFYYNYVISGFQITEFNDADSGPGNQYIEVYNNGKGPTDLYNAGYRLSVDGGTTFLTDDNWDKKPLPTYEYGIFTLNPGEDIGPEGDTIGLYRDEGGGNYILIQQVAYGQEGTAPDPLAGESVARRYDAAIVEYTNEWLRNASTGPSWGAQNAVGFINPLPNILINRVEFYPWDPVEAYVELIYRFGFGDISGFKVVCEDAVVIPTGTPVMSGTNKYYVLNQSNYPALFSNMDSSADNIYLYDSNGNLLDMVGWSSTHNQGTYMSRSPEGGGTSQGFNDATSQVAGWIFDQLPNLLITEFYADSSSATVEIYKPRGGDIVLDPTHWSMKVNAGGLTGNWNPIMITGSERYSVFTMSTGNPEDEGDTIGLNYNHGSSWTFIDEVGYGTNGVAPDPLLGESTARYWDSTNLGLSLGYTNEWTKNASTGPTWNAENNVQATNATPWLILDEVMFNPTAPDGYYITIMFNGPAGWYINTENFYLVCDDAFQIPLSLSQDLHPGDRQIIKYGDDPGLASLFQSMTPGGDNLYLYDPNGVLYDMVGWNTPHLQGMGVSRVPHGSGTYRGYDDSSSEAAGWIFNNPIQVLMTEISDSESSPWAQIEVYNPWYPNINFDSVFTFSSASTGIQLTGSWMISNADSGEYAVFNVTGGGLDHEGDTVSFLQNGILIEEISYGQKGTIPDPLPNESVERYWDGSTFTDDWSRNFITGSNFGARNDVPEANFVSPITLNEVLFYPNSANDHFVEVYNQLAMLIDISGYKIVCDTEYIIPEGTILDSNDGYFYLLYNMNRTFFDNMDSSGDNVYLYDANGSLLDMVGWNSQHNIGETVCRVPDGNGTRDGYDDVSSITAGWQFDCIPMVRLIKIDLNYTAHSNPIEYGHFESHVIFNLVIANFQKIDDIINIWSSSQEGWTVGIFDGTGTSEINNINVDADGTVNFIVNVTLPDSVPFAVMDNITIFIRSTNSGIIGDTMVLNVRVYPFLNLTKYVSPNQINIDGTGHDETTTITLNMTGMGAQVGFRKHIDCVFCIDSSGSMGGNDPGDLRKIESQNFVRDHFEMPDRGAVVDFDSNAWLIPDGWPIGDHLDSNYGKIISNIELIDSSGGTSVSSGLNLSNEELRLFGQSFDHIPIIILITDAQTGDELACIQEANIAASRGVIIFTIGLMTDDLTSKLLKDIANITGGMFFEAPDASYFRNIYENISSYLSDLAVWDDNITDPNPMVRDVLPWYIDYVPGSFSIQPDKIYIDPVTEETIIEWNIPQIKIGETWSVTFDIKSNLPGLQETNVYDNSRAFYTRWDNSVDTVLFPRCWVNVLLSTPVPPKLYIDIDPNKDDIYLYWDDPLSPDTKYYLIYCARNPRGFDFSTPWVNTLTDYDKGVIPLRNSWNHTGAALPSHGNYSEQWYYCIRSVNTLGKISHTSRTVGKWTKEYKQQGVVTFSLPLEPLETMNTSVDYYLNEMGAEYIKWMNPVNHIWMKHGDGEINDAQLEVGKGYEVKFTSPTKYTFMGMPGAMIRYNSGSFLGYDPGSDAKSLSASVDPQTGNVILTWEQPSDQSTTQCYVYYSNTRDGFHKTKDVDYFQLAILPVSPMMMTVHPGVALPNTQYYYMVIPMNSTGTEGASTYSIGIWTAGFSKKYDTIGIPLRIIYNGTTDWYCDNIPDTVGINFYMLNQQRWGWHSTRMAGGAFDPVLEITEGYQISTSNATKFTFIGY